MNLSCISYSFVARDVEYWGGGKNFFWFDTLGVLTNVVSAFSREKKFSSVSGVIIFTKGQRSRNSRTLTQF